MALALQAQLQHVVWIGGSACGGKTTIAQILADRYGVDIYSCDDAYERHVLRVDAQQHPYFHRIMHKDASQLFQPPAEEQMLELVSFYHEQFDMVIDDLLALPQSSPIVVEGAGLLPRRVVAWLTDSSQAIWLVPTAEFRATVTRFDEPGVQALIGGTDDPPQAFRNWMMRDVLFTQHVTVEAQALGLRVLVNDGRQTAQQRAATVAQLLGLSSETRGRESF